MSNDAELSARVAEERAIWLARKQAADQAKYAHPFDRSTTYDDDDELFDDGREEQAVLVTFGGGGDKLKVAPVDFFDLMGDLPVRRMFLRKLTAVGQRRHALGSSVFDIAEGLHARIGQHQRKIFLGVSLGGFNAMVLGTLLDVDAILVVDPTSSWRPALREALGDDRDGGAAALVDPSWMAEFGDVPEFWQRRPGPPVICHYPYRNPLLRGHAEHLSSCPNVRLVPHFEQMPMHKICENGSLRRWLELAIRGEREQDVVWA